MQASGQILKSLFSNAGIDMDARCGRVDYRVDEELMRNCITPSTAMTALHGASPTTEATPSVF